MLGINLLGEREVFGKTWGIIAITYLELEI